MAEGGGVPHVCHFDSCKSSWHPVASTIKL